MVLLHILREARGKGESVLVFSQRLKTLHFLREVAKLDGHDIYFLDGSTPPDDRQRTVDGFTALHTPAVFVISTRVGVVGLNIQSASRVVLFDFANSPATEERTGHREGVQVRPETASLGLWLMTATTIESSVHHISAFKRQLAYITVDGIDATSAKTKQCGALSQRAFVPARRYRNNLDGKDDILDSLVKSPVGGHIVEILSDEELARGKTFDEPGESGISFAHLLVIE
jgi:superfamily II DNA/RNA helicase